MKKIISVFILALLVVAGYSQAKKPIIMVVPSDNYCISRGYKMVFDDMGAEKVLPDYKKAMQSDQDLRLVITELGSIMAERGFPLKDLEQELKSIEQESAEMSMMSSKESGAPIAESPIDILKRTAKADIILDLDFSIKKRGPQSYITFILKGLDSYTNKQIAGASGDGVPSTSATPGLLLEEAVLAHMDEFNGRLMSTFEDMFANGREIKVLIKTWDDWEYDLEEEFEWMGIEDELGLLFEEWFAANCTGGRFSVVDASATMMRLEQVRMPMTYTTSRGDERGMDARRFVNNLRKDLRDGIEIESKVYMRGLGEAWLILGSK